MSNLDRDEIRFFIFLALILITSVVFALITAHWIFSNDWASDIGNFVQDIEKARND